jgi:hypothetical protein
MTRVHQNVLCRQFPLFIKLTHSTLDISHDDALNVGSLGLWNAPTVRCSKTKRCFDNSIFFFILRLQVSEQQLRTFLPATPKSAYPSPSHNEKLLSFRNVLLLCGHTRWIKSKQQVMLREIQGQSLCFGRCHGYVSKTLT